MSAPYRPPRVFSNPHLVTVWGKFFRRQPALEATVERWDTPDDDFVDVVRTPAGPRAPTFLLLHGLEGSARSHYTAGMLLSAQQRGWQANLLIFRTCGAELNRTSRSYHSGETSDLDFVVRRVLAERPEAPLCIAGVSLGGNVVLKWLGEQGDAIDDRVSAAVAVSVPFDLARSSAHMEHGAARVYAWNFLRSLKRKALRKLAQHPGAVDRDRILSARTMREFDDAYTSITHGFRDAAHYYERSSSIHFLRDVRVPTLLLSARDDPFHPPEILDHVTRIAAENPCLHTEFTDRGGHAGFLEGSPPFRPRYYLERRVLQFCEGVLERRRSPADGNSERNAEGNAERPVTLHESRL